MQINFHLHPRTVESAMVFPIFQFDALIVANFPHFLELVTHSKNTLDTHAMACLIKIYQS